MHLDNTGLTGSGTLTPLASVNILPYGNINLVAVRNGIVACAIENTTSRMALPLGS